MRDALRAEWSKICTLPSQATAVLLVAVAALVGSFGTAGVVLLATATPSAALSTCTDNWQGPTTGTTNWNASAANWSGRDRNTSSGTALAYKASKNWKSA